MSHLSPDEQQRMREETSLKTKEVIKTGFTIYIKIVGIILAVIIGLCLLIGLVALVFSAIR